MFPSHPKLSGILVFHSMCSFGLGSNDEAAEFLKESIYEPPRPYSNFDICLLLGRVYDRCSEEEEGFQGDVVKQEVSELNMALRARNRYLQAYKISHDVETMDDVDEKDVERWLGKFETWQALAEKCVDAGHFVYAVDAYQQALERGEEARQNPKLWYQLAKALFRSGNPPDAMVALKHANELIDNLDIKDAQIESTVENWKSREKEKERIKKEGPITLISVLEKVGGYVRRKEVKENEAAKAREDKQKVQRRLSSRDSSVAEKVSKRAESRKGLMG